MELPPVDRTNEEETSSHAITVIAESIGAYFGKLPASIQKNLLKACDHLFAIPNALSHGKAEELKAVYAARAKITEAMGTKLADSIVVDNALANVAISTHAQKILRHQKNSIGILKFAAEELSSSQLSQKRIEPKLQAEEEHESTRINDDWLNAFEAEAVNMSSEQMQKLFGKILAGEITRPSTYSIRTIKLMGQMDVDVAQIFRKFCSLCCSYKWGDEKILLDGRVLIFSHSNLLSHGLPLSKLQTLEEYGLIANVSPSIYPFEISLIREKYTKEVPTLAFTYNNGMMMLAPIAPKTEADFESLMMNGVALSRVGRELLNIVEIEEKKEYTENLFKHFESLGVAVVDITDHVERRGQV